MDDDERDPDLVAEAREERRRFRRLTTCQCGHDMPGRCPGPAFCPLTDLEEEDDDAAA